MNEENSKKIIFLEAVQDYGGARISTLELAERLATKHDVTIVDFYGSCTPFLDGVSEKNLKIRVIQKRDKEYIITTSKLFWIRFFKCLLFIPHLLEVRKKLAAIVKTINPDYIIINNFKTLSALIYFPKKKVQNAVFRARMVYIVTNFRH